MRVQKPVRVFVFFASLVVLAVVYSSPIFYYPGLIGETRVDGSIGIMLGLYICSHPVANLLDMLLFDHGAHTLGTSRSALFAWIGLNTLMIIIGWIVITVGATRFTRP